MVSGRSIALFIHILGAITLFIAMGLVQRVGARMRTAASIEELRLWLSLMKTTGTMWPSAFGLILISGVYMAGTAWSFDTPWIVTAIGSVVVMVALGGGVIGRSFSSIGRAAGQAAQLDGDLRGMVNRPALWVAATALNGMAMGVLWLMVNKPGWGQSLAVVISLGLVGAAAGAVMTRRGGATQSRAVVSG